MMNPNQEEYWADLLNKVSGKRVHGVKGFDAYKECAKQSKTDRFIPDGDNIVMDDSLTQELDFPEKDGDGNDTPRKHIQLECKELAEWISVRKWWT